jgi:hypothetical protein
MAHLLTMVMQLRNMILLLSKQYNLVSAHINCMHGVLYVCVDVALKALCSPVKNLELERFCWVNHGATNQVGIKIILSK